MENLKIGERNLEHFRNLIDEVDSMILQLLSFRSQVVKNIAEVKLNNKYPIRDLEREERILSGVRQQAQRVGLNVEATEKIFGIIIEDSAKQQQELLGEG